MSVRESAAPASSRALPSPAAMLGYGALAAIAAWWTWRAFHDRLTLDVGLAYQAGQVAWSTGHPEHLFSWDGTPFLAAVMALLSRIISGGTTADLLNVLNLGLVVAAVGVAMQRLRSFLTPAWWWITAFALVSFGPMMSSIWWKQFNVISLTLAILAFELMRRGRNQWSGAALGLSIAVKPIVFLLPLVLLVRRRTRRAGAGAVAWVLGLNLAGQALIAARAGSISALSPWIPLHNFIHKAQPANTWACHPENFAPGSLLCQLAGGAHWTLQHFVVWAAVALIGAWIIDALRGRSATSWELFAFACPISVMLSPLAWSHYQIMLAPLFVLLIVRFTRLGATVGEWAGIAAAFVLASLVWQPFGTSIGAVAHVLFGTHEGQHGLFMVASVAQFAQYVLVLTGILWYTRSAASARRL